MLLSDFSNCFEHSKFSVVGDTHQAPQLKFVALISQCHLRDRVGGWSRVFQKIFNASYGLVEKKKTKTFYAAKIVSFSTQSSPLSMHYSFRLFLTLTGDLSTQEKASKNQRNPMLFWESKLIHKMRGKSKYESLVNFKSSFSWHQLFLIACVPGLYYIGTDSSVPNQQFHVMVMDLLGPSLEDLLQSCKRSFDLKTVLMIAIQMIKRIEKVHEERIIHRDIKPANFLIHDGVIKLSDFGFARVVDDLDQPLFHTFLGSPLYMAPQILGR